MIDKGELRRLRAEVWGVPNARQVREGHVGDALDAGSVWNQQFMMGEKLHWKYFANAQCTETKIIEQCSAKV